MKLTKCWLVGMALLLLLSVSAFAFTSPGTKALGMGGAFTAVADEPSCVFWNPAGLTQLGRFELSASLSATGENVENFVNLYDLYKALENRDYEAAEKIAEKEFPLPMSLEPTLNLEIAIAHRLAISGAAQTEFSITKFEPPTLTTSYVEIEDTETVLTPVYLTYATGLPASAFKVGLNAKYIQGIRHSSHFRLLATGDVETDSEETSNAQTVTSFDLGVLYAPEDSKLTYGLMVEDVFEPKVKFPDMTDESLKYLTLSRKVNFGVAFKVFPRLTLAADVHNVTSDERTFHIGGELDLSLLKLRAGLNDGNITYGLNLKLLFLSLEAAYCQREGRTPVVSLVLLRLGI